MPSIQNFKRLFKICDHLNVYFFRMYALIKYFSCYQLVNTFFKAFIFFIFSFNYKRPITGEAKPCFGLAARATVRLYRLFLSLLLISSSILQVLPPSFSRTKNYRYTFIDLFMMFYVITHIQSMKLLRIQETKLLLVVVVVVVV